MPPSWSGRKNNIGLVKARLVDVVLLICTNQKHIQTFEKALAIAVSNSAGETNLILKMKLPKRQYQQKSFSGLPSPTNRSYSADSLKLNIRLGPSVILRLQYYRNVKLFGNVRLPRGPKFKVEKIFTSQSKNSIARKYC